MATWYIPYWSGLNSFATEYQGMPAYEGFYRQVICKQHDLYRHAACSVCFTCVASFA